MSTYTVDSKGHFWKWNCGWWKVDRNGNVQNMTKPLGHLAFRRAVTIANPAVKKDREVLHGMDKPGRFWRRHVTRHIMNHDQFGSVAVLATDGCHAVVEVLGEHKYVCFENLSEPAGIPLPPRVNREVKPRETATKVKVSQLLAKYAPKP